MYERFGLSPWVVAPALSVGIFFAMVAFLEIGYRMGRRADKGDGTTHEGIGAMQAAIFALLGLLLAFAFAGGMSRLEARRQLMIQEANAIGTAYLRIDLVPPSAQPELRRMFREYLQARFAVYDTVANPVENARFRAKASELQRQIWSHTVAAGQFDAAQNTTKVTIPAINEMIDVTTSRAVAAQTHLPGLVLALLLIVALLSALTAGYDMSKRPRRSVLHACLYAAVVAATVYVVLDLDHPRFGLVRLDATEQMLRDLSDSIGD